MSGKPHICFVAPQAYPVLARSKHIQSVGGAEVQQSIIARGLVKEGYRISMICLDYGQEDHLEIDGIRIIKAHKPDEGIPVFRFIHPRLTSFWKAMKRADADIYYQRAAGMLTGNVASFSKAHRKKFIYATANNTDFMPDKERIKYRRDQLLYTFGLKNADVVVVQNEEQKRLCKQNYGIESILIRSCYDVHRHSGEYSPCCEVLWVSTIAPHKQPELCVKVATYLPEFQFKMIGGAGSGKVNKAYFQKIERMAKDVKNINFMGFVPYSEIDQHFDSAKIFLNTSKHEGFPNTFLQAWSRGIPTVSLYDYVAQKPPEPISIAVENESEVVQTVKNLMSDPSKRKEKGEHCKKYFETHHSVSKSVAAYSDIFRSLVGD